MWFVVPQFGCVRRETDPVDVRVVRKHKTVLRGGQKESVCSTEVQSRSLAIGTSEKHRTHVLSPFSQKER